MLIEQISIFVENKAGHLASITDVIGEADVDIRALLIADTADFGILRMIVSDPVKAEAALKKEGYTVVKTHVIAFGVPDEPGGLSRVLRMISDEGIQVEYLYAFIGNSKSQAYVVIKVEDNEKTLGVLKKNDVNIMTSNGI